MPRKANFVDAAQFLAGSAALILPASVIWGWGPAMMIAGCILIIDVWFDLWRNE